jgi:Rieske Fe-S protein
LFRYAFYQWSEVQIMSERDKYPADSGRRRFVKGVVGGAALAGVGATGAAAVNSATTSPGAGGGTTQAYAIENTDGPAPRGMPQIPVEVDSEGFLKGVW